MGVKREANLVILGNYNVGKKNIASNFTGVAREGIVQEVGWSEQLVAKKELDVSTNASITIKSTPNDFGRMVNHRLREQTYQAAQGYIVVFHNNEARRKDNNGKFDFEWYVRAQEKKPILLIGTTIDGKVKKNEEVEKYANGIGATYIVLDTTKLNVKENENYKLMEKSIRNLVFTIFKEPIITDEKEKEEKKLNNSVPSTPAEKKKEYGFGDLYNSMKEIFNKKPVAAKTA